MFKIGRKKRGIILNEDVVRIKYPRAKFLCERIKRANRIIWLVWSVVYIRYQNNDSSCATLLPKILYKNLDRSIFSVDFVFNFNFFYDKFLSYHFLFSPFQSVIYNNNYNFVAVDVLGFYLLVNIDFYIYHFLTTYDTHTYTHICFLMIIRF